MFNHRITDEIVKGFEAEISAAIENGSSVEATALALFKAARVEEWENLRTFGRAYRAYIRRTRMFIPYLF